MFLVDWAVKMRIRPPEFETSICDAKYHVSLRRPSSPLSSRRRRRRPLRRKFVSGQFDEENPSVQISSRLLVEDDEGVSYPVVDGIGVIYRNLPRRADVIVTTVGARHKCQQGSVFEHPIRGADPDPQQQALSVIHRGSWGDVARRFTMIRLREIKTPKAIQQTPPLSLLPSPSSPPSPPTADAASVRIRRNLFRPSRRGDSIREIFVGFLVQTGEGVEILVVDRIRRRSNRSTVEVPIPSWNWCIDRSRAPILNFSAEHRERDPDPPLRHQLRELVITKRGKAAAMVEKEIAAAAMAEKEIAASAKGIDCFERRCFSYEDQILYLQFLNLANSLIYEREIRCSQ
ncbi:hypothetical protein F511_03493 [Dorcoceras hygrometricum]|uniref:Uncharacterized protein n=1 Tax=Dorcoceras hygrometricum TaxID=472368 RepID=A0A2Z7AS01_9LAMI|nr:hypothetical protein F511_03493 [Dorcoceras hygrometricum]